MTTTQGTVTLEGPGAIEVAGQGQDDLSETLALLRRAVATIDRLWNDARTGPGGGSLVVALGEASQGVHRAVSALLSDPSDWVYRRPVQSSASSPGR